MPSNDKPPLRLVPPPTSPREEAPPLAQRGFDLDVIVDARRAMLRAALRRRAAVRDWPSSLALIRLGTDEEECATELARIYARRGAWRAFKRGAWEGLVWGATALAGAFVLLALAGLIASAADGKLPPFLGGQP